MSWIVGVAIKELEIFVSQIFLQHFSVYFFFSITLLYHYFSILFLPTTFNHTHTHNPRPLPTTHDPRHLATLIDAELTCLFIVCETMFTIGESQAISYENATEQQTQERRL